MLSNYDKFVDAVANIDSLAELLDNISPVYDSTPWADWFGAQYCENCEDIKCTREEAADKLGLEPFYGGTITCGYCEFHGNCKYFPDLKEVPTIKQTIKYWLEAEVIE